MKDTFTRNLIITCTALGAAGFAHAQVVEDFDTGHVSIFTPVGDNSFVSNLSGGDGFALRFPGTVGGLAGPTGFSFGNGGGGGGSAGSGGSRGGPGPSGGGGSAGSGGSRFFDSPPVVPQNDGVPQIQVPSGPVLDYIYTNALQATVPSYITFNYKIDGEGTASDYSFYVLGLDGNPIPFTVGGNGVDSDYIEFSLENYILEPNVDYAFAVGISRESSESSFSMIIDDIVLKPYAGDLGEIEFFPPGEPNPENPTVSVPDTGSLGIFGLLAAMGAYVARRRRLF